MRCRRLTCIGWDGYRLCLPGLHRSCVRPRQLLTAPSARTQPRPRHQHTPLHQHTQRSHIQRGTVSHVRLQRGTGLGQPRVRVGHACVLLHDAADCTLWPTHTRCCT